MKIQKNTPALHKIGTYGNYVTLIPLEILSYKDETALIKYEKLDHTQIELYTDFSQIDFSSFGIKTKILYTIYKFGIMENFYNFLFETENYQEFVEFRKNLPKSYEYSYRIIEKIKIV